MRNKVIYIWLAITLCLAPGGLAAFAQGKPPLEYQVKAAFLFNFTRFIHWPSTAYVSPDAPFIIGIAGNDPFGTYLDDLVNGEQTDGHRIIVRRYADGQDLNGCQLLFINLNDQAKEKAILAQASRQNTLTVSDADDFITAGGMLQFYKEDNKIKMEIKLGAVKAAQIDVSSKLLQVAKIR